MMPPDFGKKIKDYLFLNKEISLPGLGYFKLCHIDQYLSPYETIIHPPQQKIRFITSKRGKAENRKFKTYYVDKATNKRLEREVQELVNDVLNFGKGNLEGLGHLFKGENDEFTFISENLISSPSKYLPVIDTTNLAESASSQKVSSVKSIQPESSITNSDAENFSSFDQRKTTDRDVLVNKKKKNNFSNKLGVLWLSATAVLAVLTILFISSLSQKSDAVEVLESSVGAPTLLETSESHLINEVFSREVQIVIGSFLNEENALALKYKYESKYVVSIQESDSKYRVVIEGSSDQDFIYQIKSEVNTEAWIL